MKPRQKDRVFLLEEIAAAELKLAQMDFQEASEEAMPYVVSGKLMPHEIRFRVEEALQKLKRANEKYEQAAKDWRKVMG